VPWHEGAGFERWRSKRPPRSRVPYGFAPLVLALMLGVAFAAAGYAKGWAWAVNGTVRYHFMAESETALLPWGLWIASHPWLSVAVSTVVVVVEHAAILGMFWRAGWRLAMGLVVIGLIAGFAVFHRAIWPAWWVLLLGFMPWEWLNRPRVAGAPVEPGPRRLPPLAVLAVVLLVVQQAVVSALRVEAGPYFSAYDMYSATFSSPAEFEQINGGPRFHVPASIGGRVLDVGDCVRANRPAIRELEAAAAAEPVPDLPVARRRVVSCAAEVGAERVRVLADQRTFDWDHGRTGFRFRDRLLAEWPVPTVAAGTTP